MIYWYFYYSILIESLVLSCVIPESDVVDWVQKLGEQNSVEFPRL